jgi:hypothetical protein
LSTKLVSPHAREDYLARNVHDESTYRVWQRRFYDFNIWSEKKRLEKLDTMHGNLVQQGLVKIPAHWPVIQASLQKIQEAWHEHCG